MFKSLNYAKIDIQIVEKNEKLTIQTVYLKDSRQFGKVILANCLDKLVYKG